MNNVTCAKCKEKKQIEDFNASELKRSTYSRCRDCMRSYKTAEKKKPRELDLDDTDISNRTWQGGKYHGHILDKNNTFYPRVSGKHKSFRYDDANKDKVYDLANQWRKDKSNELNLTSNRYKIVFDGDVPKYLIVQLSKDYITLVDYDYKDVIKSHFMCVTRSGHENSQYYCNITVDSKNKGLHGHLTGFNMVDHINGYPLDNRKCNLRDTNYSENNKNRSLIHKTSCMKSKDKNNNYEAIIIYNDHTLYFQKIMINEVFATKELAKQWIETKCTEIDAHLNKIPNRQLLKQEYEDIMAMHSDGYKWRDLFDTISTNNIQQATPTNEKQTIRNDNYNLFKNIDPDWVMPDVFKSSIKLEHITHNNLEYKFCTKCNKWVTIEKFHKSSSKHDGLDTRCKSCAKLNKKHN